jgi:hypothetical protein
MAVSAVDLYNLTDNNVSYDAYKLLINGTGNRSIYVNCLYQKPILRRDFQVRSNYQNNKAFIIN